MPSACRLVPSADRSGSALATVRSHKPWSAHNWEGKRREALPCATRRKAFFIIHHYCGICRNVEIWRMQRWGGFQVRVTSCSCCPLKERSHTSAPGRDVSGVLPVLMSWLAISGNTPARSRSSAACAAVVSPALTTWPCTWRGTRAENRFWSSLFRMCTKNIKPTAPKSVELLHLFYNRKNLITTKTSYI